MPHRIDHLRETLRGLEAELARVDTLDDESRQMLQTAAAEIEETLENREPLPPTEAVEPPDDSWTHSLSEAATNFEQSHPALSRAIGSVASALAQLGI